MRAIALPLALLMLLLTVSARAQEEAREELAESTAPTMPEEPSAEARASALIDEGVALRRQGKEIEAVKLFQRAHAIHPTPRSFGQMGLAEKSLRQYVSAERHLAAALTAEDDEWVIANRDLLERAKLLVGSQLAWLLVETNVPHAELVVNGAVVARLPMSEPVRVAAGPLVVGLRADGYVGDSTSTVVPAESLTELRIDMQPAPKPSRPPAPPPPDRAATPDEPASWTPWIITSAAAATLATGVGIGLAVHTASLKKRRDSICPEAECDTQEGVDVDHRMRRMAIGSTVSFAAGAALGVTALILWLVEPSEDVEVSLGPLGAGLGYRF